MHTSTAANPPRGVKSSKRSRPSPSGGSGNKKSSRPGPSKRPERAASGATASSSAAYRNALTPEIETELAEIAAATGCELINAEWKGGILRLILDRQPDPIAISPLPSSALPDRRSSAAPEPTNESASAAGDSESAGADGADFPTAPLAPAAVSGISLGDCEHVAKLASGYLDMLDFGQGRYVLEVSSPGLDRQLYRPGDYERFVGRLARVTYEVPPVALAAAGTTPAGGRPGKRTVVARLAGAGGGQVTMVDEATGERLTLPLQTIRLARLEVEL